LAEDFDKLVKDPSNGFPHHHIAMEMHRRGNQSLDDIKSSMLVFTKFYPIIFLV